MTGCLIVLPEPEGGGSVLPRGPKKTDHASLSACVADNRISPRWRETLGLNRICLSHRSAPTGRRRVGYYTDDQRRDINQHGKKPRASSILHSPLTACAANSFRTHHSRQHPAALSTAPRPNHVHYRRRLTPSRLRTILRHVQILPIDFPDDGTSTPIVRVPARLSHENADALKRTAEHCFACHEVSRLVLDLSLVEVVTSIGVTSLLEAKQLASDHSAEMVLAGLPTRHREFFSLLRVEGLFQFADSVDDAVSDGS